MRVAPVLLAVIIATVCAEPGVWPVAYRDCRPGDLERYRREVRRLQENEIVPGSRFKVPS